MNRYIYRFIAAVLAAITIVSCNDARKSEAYRLLEDASDGSGIIRNNVRVQRVAEF